MRSLLLASIVVLAGCTASKKEAVHHHDAHAGATLASHEGKSGCHGGVKSAEMASADGKHCAMKAELASAEGAEKKCASKVEMASVEGKNCSMKKAEMAAVEAKAAGCHGDAAATMASAAAAEKHDECGDCPKKADGSCDHEAGAKAGRECCKNHLAKAATP